MFCLCALALAADVYRVADNHPNAARYVDYIGSCGYMALARLKARDRIEELGCDHFFNAKR